MVQRYSNKIF